MTFEEWRVCYPQAAADLAQVFAPPEVKPVSGPGLSEAWAQQHARFDIARAGAMAWRNNIGVLPDKRGVPVRFGLANDSHAVNERIKSGDLILAIPRVIRSDMVGSTIAQFGSVELKAPGWVYSGSKREVAQLAWATLIRKLGGYATFSTGKVEL